ncbi:MAG: tetratricopeptide repeat protein, partial [Anaerolineae bacterium]|nr:tetratricopeptide repeat protein [Anaerolineae bacterium]
MEQADQEQTENIEHDLNQQIETIRARLWQGDYDTQHEVILNRTHSEAVTLRNLPLQIRSMRLLGTLAYLAMNLDQARTYINRAMALAMRLQDTAEMLTLGANLGYIYRGKGDPQEAVRRFTPFIEKLDLIEITPQLSRSAVTALLRYVVCLVLSHDYDQAQTRLQQANQILKHYDETDLTPEESLGFSAYSAYARAVIAMARGDYDSARVQCQKYDDANRRLGRYSERLLGRLLLLRVELFTEPDEEAC